MSVYLWCSVAHVNMYVLSLEVCQTYMHSGSPSFVQRMGSSHREPVGTKCAIDAPLTAPTDCLRIHFDTDQSHLTSHLHVTGVTRAWSQSSSNGHRLGCNRLHDTNQTWTPECFAWDFHAIILSSKGLGVSWVAIPLACLPVRHSAGPTLAA